MPTLSKTAMLKKNLSIILIILLMLLLIAIVFVIFNRRIESIGKKMKMTTMQVIMLITYFKTIAKTFFILLVHF